MASVDVEREAGSLEEEEEGFDLERAKELAGFAWRATRRHPKLAISLFVTVLGLAIAAAVLWPRTYSTEVKILAQRNLVLPALGNPGRAVPRDADNPTKNVGDTILRRDNVISLIKQADLVDRWDAQRPPLLRLKDEVMQVVMGPPSEEDKMRALVGVVEKKLYVTNDDTSITIAVDWTNPDMAYELASLVQKNLLDARYDADVGMITDAIAILQEHAKTEKENVDSALAELEQVRRDHGAGGAPLPATSAAPSPAPAPAPYRPAPAPAPAATTTATAATPAAPAVDPELQRQLDDKRAQIKAIEDARSRRVAELNRQLQEALVTLAPAHPTVVGLKDLLEQAKQDPPQLVTLRREEADLSARVEAQREAASTAPTPAPTTSPRPAPGPVAVGGPRPAAPTPAPASPTANTPYNPANEDPQIGVARQKLETAQHKYDELNARIESANIELDVARAAFKYRFSVVRPAERPRKPSKPNVALLVVGGFLAALFLAMLAPSLKDMASGRLIESWQVKRKLDIPLLGDLRLP